MTTANLTEERIRKIAREFAEREISLMEAGPDDSLRRLVVSAMAQGFLGGWSYGINRGWEAK